MSTVSIYGTGIIGTNFAATLATKQVGCVSTTVLIAADDQNAKHARAAIVSGAGLEAVDVGTVSRARELEVIGFLQLTLAVGGKRPWTGGFALVR